MSKVKSLGLVGLVLALLAALLLCSVLFSGAQNAYAEEIDTNASYTNVNNGNFSLAVHKNGSFFAEAACIESTLPFPDADPGTTSEYKSQADVDKVINNGKTLGNFEQIKKIIYIYSQTDELSAYSEDDRYHAAWAAVAHFACDELPTYAADYGKNTNGSVPKDASAWGARPAYDYLLTKAESSDVVVPDGLELAFFQDPVQAFSGGHKTQTMIALKLYGNSSGGGGDTPTPSITNTTAKVDDTAGSIELASGTEGTMTDVVELENLASGTTYTLVSTLYKDGKAFGDSVENKVTSSPVTVTFSQKITEAGTYTIKTELKNGDTVVTTHNGNLDDTSETVTVTVKEDTTTPSIQTSALGKDSGDQTIEAKAGQVIIDTVTYKNLTVGSTYQLQARLMDKSTGKELESSKAQWTYQLATGKFTADKANGTQQVTININADKMSESDEIVVFEYLHELNADGSTKTENVATHENINDAKQLITVTAATEPSVTEGSIGTMLKVGGTSAASGNLLCLEGATTAWLVDTIAYEGLTAGETYTVTGTLMRFGADDTTGSAVGDSVTETFTADAASGTWDMVFGHVQLEANSYYVVHEKVVDSAGNEVASHADNSDFAQAVAVKPLDDITIVEIPKTSLTPATGLEMATTVDIDGKAASANSPRTVSYADVSKVKTVNDTIAYSGFGAGETYTLTGKLMDVTNTSAPKLVKEAKLENQQASEAGEGTWKMKFEGVTLEAGHTYVVYEYALDAEGNEVAKHENPNDKAQTIVVTAKPTTPSAATKGSTAKTADTYGGIIVALGIVAVLAGAAAFGARRKSNR